MTVDEPIENRTKYLKISVYYASLDIILVQFEKRYEVFKNIYSNFEILKPQILLQAEECEIISKAKKLTDKYHDDLTPNLATELIQTKNLLENQLKEMRSIREFADFIFDKNELLISSIPDLCTAFQLFLVLPVTSAQSERTFSKLKLIKNFVRSTMTQSRLSSLAIISIEHERAKHVDLDAVVDRFLSTRYKRKNC